MGNRISSTRMSIALSNYLVSWVVTYLGHLQPTYIGVIIYLLSTMDIPASSKICRFVPLVARQLGATEATAIVEQPPAGETQEILQVGSPWGSFKNLWFVSFKWEVHSLKLTVRT